MKKWGVLSFFLLLPSLSQAYSTVFNPFTGKLDYVGVSTSSLNTNFVANQNTLQSGATFYVSSGTVGAFNSAANHPILTLNGRGGEVLRYQIGAGTTDAFYKNSFYFGATPSLVSHETVADTTAGDSGFYGYTWISDSYSPVQSLLNLDVWNNGSGSIVRIPAINGLTVTYGVTMASGTVNGTGAGEIDFTEGTAPAGVASSDVIWGDSTSHWLKFIPNNGNTYFVVGSSTSNSAGTFAKWSGAGSLDNLTGMSWASSSGITISTPTVYTGITNWTLSSLVYATFGDTTTFNAFVQVASSMAVTGTTSSPYILTVSTTLAGPYTLAVSTTGHVNYEDFASSPVLSGCGTNPAIIGNDTVFQITGGTGSNGCTAVFAKTYTKVPICQVSQESMSLINALSYTVSVATLTITQTGMGTSKLDVHCFGRD